MRWLRSCVCCRRDRDRAHDDDGAAEDTSDAGTQTGEAGAWPALWDHQEAPRGGGVSAEEVAAPDAGQPPGEAGASPQQGAADGEAADVSPAGAPPPSPIMERIECVIDRVISSRQTVHAVRAELGDVDARIRELSEVQSRLRAHLESIESMQRDTADEMSTLSATAALMFCESDDDDAGGGGAGSTDARARARGAGSAQSSPSAPVGPGILVDGAAETGAAAAGGDGAAGLPDVGAGRLDADLDAPSPASISSAAAAADRSVPVRSPVDEGVVLMARAVDAAAVAASAGEPPGSSSTSSNADVVDADDDDDDGESTPPRVSARISTSVSNPFSASVPQTRRGGASDFLDACKVSSIASNFVSPKSASTLSPGRGRDG